MNTITHRLRKGGAPHLTVCLLLLLSVLWQGCVVQGHFHDPAFTKDHVAAGAVNGASIAASTEASRVTKGKSRVPEAPACRLCEAQALFGVALSPAPPAILSAPSALAVWFSPVLARFWLYAISSHRWQSRAPPVSTHAA